MRRVALRGLITASLALLTSYSHALTVEQASKIQSRFDNTHGNAVEIKFSFQDAFNVGDELLVRVGDTQPLAVTSSGSLTFKMLVMRFRFKAGEEMSATHLRGGVPLVLSTLTPDVKRSFDFFPKEKLSLNVLATDRAQTLQQYGLPEGSCMLLFNNFFYDGMSPAPRLVIQTNSGRLQVKVAERLAANAFFGISPITGESLGPCKGAVEPQ